MHHAGLRHPRPPAGLQRRRRRRPRRLPDPVKAVKKFSEKQHLNFELLADEDHAVCEAYGVWVEKSMYGKTYWGAKRATFVIDEDGVVRAAFKANPETHDADVLSILGELNAAA